MSLSTNVSNLATRIATEVKAVRTLLNGNVADLSALSTTDKTNLVNAINELYSSIGNTASLPSGSTDLVDAINDLKDLIDNIDLTAIINDSPSGISTSSTWSSSKINNIFGPDVSGMAGSTVSDRLNGLNTSIGNMFNLPSGSINLVDAINDLKALIDNIDLSALINDGDIATNTTWSSYKIDSEIASGVLAGIDDAVVDTNKTWSSSKIDSEITDAVAAVVNMAPEALDTLNELAAALDNDASYASTITTALAGKSDTGHGHMISDVMGLQTALDGKASAANVGDTTVNYVETFESGLV